LSVDLIDLFKEILPGFTAIFSKNSMVLFLPALATDTPSSLAFFCEAVRELTQDFEAVVMVFIVEQLAKKTNKKLSIIPLGSCVLNIVAI
jgi:hypothetical protein